MKKAWERWLCLLLTVIMLAGLWTVPVVAEKTADDYNVGYDATVSVTDTSGNAVPAGYNGENWWRAGIQSINDYFVHSEPHFWGYNYTINPSSLPVNVDFDYGLKPVDIGTVTLAENLRSAEEIDKGRYTKILLQYFNGTDWTTITPAAGTGYTVNDDSTISLDWANKARSEVLADTTKQLDFIDIDLGARYVSDKFRMQILAATGNGDAWGEFGIDEILMYGVEADGDGIAANGDAYLNALGEKAAAEAKKMADADTIAAAQALVNGMASASRKAVLTEELTALAENPWTNLALTATVTDGLNGTTVSCLNDGDTVGTTDKTWSLPAATAEESAWFKYDYGKKVAISRIDFGARVVNNSFTSIDIYAINGGTETKIDTYTLDFNRVPESSLFNAETDFTKEAFARFAAKGQIATTGNLEYSDFCSINFETAVQCEAIKIVVKDVKDGFANRQADCTECRTWGTEATEPEVQYDDYNIGYDATVSVADTSGNAVPAGYNGENWWRAGIQGINDYFVHSDANYWGYIYTINPSSLPVNVDFDYGMTPANIGKITLAEPLRSTEEINKGRYTKILLQYFNGTAWTDITPAAGTGYTVNDDSTISLDWANKARSEVLAGGTTQLDFIDIDLGARYASDKFRVQVLEATGNGDAWGEFSIAEILMYGVEADAAAIAANGDAYLNALGEKAAAEAKMMADADTLAAAKTVVAGMKDATRKEALTAELDALAADPWTNLALNATVTDGLNGTTVSYLNDGNTVGTSDKTWSLPAATAEESAWFKYDYGRKVSINRIDFGARVVNNSFKSIDVYAINGETETKIDTYTLDFNRVPETGLFNGDADFTKEAFARFAAKGQIATTGNLEYSDFCSISFETAVQCEAIKIVVKDVKDGFANRQADCTECRTWGTRVREVVTEYDDYNVGYEAEVSVTNTSGSEVSAGVNGGYGYSWWRTGVQDINNYFVHGSHGVWGWNYTVNPDKLPLNIDFDYGLTPANIGKVTLSSALASETEINKGRYTKVILQYFNGTEWITITPAAATGYTVNNDGSVSLDWANKTRREAAVDGTVDFIDIDLGARYVSDQFRVQITEATGNGDCWGEFNIPEILMYGVSASEDDIYYSGGAFNNALGEKAAAEAKEMADADTVAAAKAVVSQMTDADRKAALTAELDALAADPWTNLALTATVTDGLNGTTVSSLNDGKTDQAWSMAGDTPEATSWIQYDYGKTVTVNRIDLGARNMANAITKVDVYAILNGTETKVGSYTLSSSRVPEKNFYIADADLSKEAFAYFTAEGLLDSAGEIQYSEFDSVVFESSVVCDSLKVVVQGVTTGFRTADKTEFNDAPAEAQCTELRTWGTVGENATHNYTETNKAFKKPVTMYDQSGNEVKASEVDGYRNLSTEYVTDFSIYEADWYDTAFDYTKLPFFVEIDYEGEMVELSRAMLSSTRNGRNGGLVQSGKFQMFDGAVWKDITLAQTQDEGVTVAADGVTFSLDWEKPSIYDQTQDDYKAYYHMDVKFADPTIGFKLRLLVTAAGNDGGTFHIDELMTWGWTPVQTDIDSRENAADINAKKNTYLLDLAFINPNQKNVDAAKAIINTMGEEDKALYTKALDKLGVWDKLAAAGSAGSGIYPDGLTDGKYSEASQRWDSTNTTIDEKSWVQINFEAPVQVNKLRLAERYFPVALTKVNVYAKVGDELVPIYLNQSLGFANAPELRWFTGNPGAQFDAWANQAYTDNGLLRDDGNELEVAAWVELDFPSDITCDAIRVQILDAERGWGGYGLAELEAIGRIAPESNAFAIETGVKHADDHTDATSLAAVKTRGGYFVANLGNPAAAAKEVTMLVVYYKEGEVINTDSKVISLTSKSYQEAQKLDLSFDGLRASCDAIQCYVWSEISSEETARGTNTAIELK